MMMMMTSGIYGKSRLEALVAVRRLDGGMHE